MVPFFIFGSIFDPMRSGLGLVGASVAVFLATLTVTVFPASQGLVSTFDVAQGVPSDSRGADDFVGSAACARCHQDDYDQWKKSLHVRMTKPIAEAEVIGDFGDARLTGHDRSFVFDRDKGQPVMRVSFGDRAAETFRVDYTLGFKRFQGYMSMLPDGRMYVLPAFWHVETKRWLDWKEITPVPDGAHDLRQIWNSNCFNCHATNLARGFDVATRTFKTTWTEMGIGCEACHGPGRRHIELIDAAQKDPSLKPGGTLEIYTSTSGSPRQAFDTCGCCHGNKKNVFVNFTAGSRYEDFAVPFLISAPIPENDLQGEFWPDGRPNRFNRTQALTMSGCFKAGEIACTTCHVAHGSPNPFSLRVDITKGDEGDKLCTQCHTRYQRSAVSFQPHVAELSLSTVSDKDRKGDDVGNSGSEAESRAESRKLRAETELERHTFHAASSEGSRCINCHMSDVNWRLLIRRRDHTFQAPVPEITAAFGAPNACTTCHDDKSPEWAARQMDAWWDNGDRRRAQLAIADTMYRAGSGDAAVLPELARLAVDRSQGLLIRASAVEFMEQFAAGTAGSASADAQSQTSFVGPDTAGAVRQQGSAIRRPARVVLTPAQVNALIGAAADPEATVRAHAVTALIATGERDRILAPLTARLVDSARVVRVRVAEALLALGVAELPGAAGAMLAKAQDEYAAALGEFNDLPDNHTALGWLHAERGRLSAAHAALDDAISLNPKIARPYVIKGVIAAREGKFAEAAGLWRKAKSVDPAYPNIDQLIAEADKRK
jgi:predicted CXXCH cytochrome family protein